MQDDKLDDGVLGVILRQFGEQRKNIGAIVAQGPGVGSLDQRGLRPVQRQRSFDRLRRILAIAGQSPA